MQQELPFARREEFEAELIRRDLSTGAIQLLLLMFEAANGTAPPGIVGQFKSPGEPCYLMECRFGQHALAQYCGITSDSSFRALCVRLERAGVLKRVTKSAGSGKQTVYILRLKTLIDLPASDKTEAIEQVADFLTEKTVASVFGNPLPVVNPVEIPDRVEDNPDQSRVFTARLKSMNPNSDRLLMSSITDADVRLIGGFATEGGDRSTLPTDEQRIAVFARYWQDAKLREGNLTSADCLELLALFIHKARNKAHGKSAQPRGAAVAAWWRNRRSMPLANTLKPQEIQEARRLLESRRKPTEQPAQAPARADVVTPVAAVPQIESESPRASRLDLKSLHERIRAGAAEREQLLAAGSRRSL